jgi:membrane-bound lytic murein transglycosylase D
MKYLSIFPVLLLTSCQSITPPIESEPNQNSTPLIQPISLSQQDDSVDPAELALPDEINQALLADVSIDIIHPIDDVAVDFAEVKPQHDDLWTEIGDSFTLPIPENKRLTSQRNWYAKHPEYLDRVAKRAEPFLYYIVQELKANDMPIELALLPIVESAFDPFAYSHGQASGMWQFVPATGLRFGMKQNWWYDGRRDIIASTEGAIKYLKRLHKYFDNDWLLALAAYNSGEGRVRRAVKKNQKLNKPIDFWSLELPRETRAYVPKLLALADIIKRPADFDITLYSIENKSVITQVDIGSQLDLAKAAKLADLTLSQLQRLNPGFNHWSTAPNGPHRLLLPLNKQAQFVTGLNKLSEKDRLTWKRYKIKNGDSLGLIAQKFNTTKGVIKQVNDINGTQIRAGKYLLIPVAAQSLDSYILSQNQRLAKKQSKNKQARKVIHIVKSGDSFWDLGIKYKVNHKHIAKWNGMAPKDTLKLNQKLVIWQKQTKTNSSAKNTYRTSVENTIMRNITYKVKRGDSFARIADKFNILIKDIERWNNLSRKDYLQPGQRLKLSVDVTNNI